MKLYLIMSEERQILVEIFEGNMQDVVEFEQMDADKVLSIKDELMTQEQWLRLENVKDRKKALRELVKA